MPRLTLRERIFGRTEDRSFPIPDNEIPLTASPIPAATALKIADVWAAVRVLADSVSSLPLHVYRKAGDGRERVTSGFLVDLLERPAPGVTQADLTSTLMAHLAIHGNAWLAKWRQGGEIVQLALLDPDRVRPELENGRLRFRYSPGSGPQQMLTERDVIHIKGLSTDSLTGLSAVSQAARVLGLSDELVKHALAFFETGGTPPVGLLQIPDISAETRTRLMEQMANESKPHGIWLLEGPAEYEAVRPKLDDSQFVEQRRLAAQEVARVFRIPSHFLNAGTGGDSLTYSTSESLSADFLKYTLAPWLRRIELAISGDRDLTSERQYVRFSVDGLLRASARDRAEIYRLGLDPVGGWLDVNEVRAWEDLPPREERPRPTPLVATNGAGDPNRIPEGVTTSE